MADELFQEPEDATPLTPEERADLISAHITYRAELNEAEQENHVPCIDELPGAVPRSDAGEGASLRRESPRVRVFAAFDADDDGHAAARFQRAD